MSWFQRLRDGLSKTRDNISKSVPWNAKSPEEILEELEYALISADVGVDATGEVIEEVRASGKKDVREALKQALVVQLEPDAFRAKIRKAGFSPNAKKSTLEPAGKVVLMVGVNGVGKTTTIAKLGQYYREREKRDVLRRGYLPRGGRGTARAMGRAPGHPGNPGPRGLRSGGAGL